MDNYKQAVRELIYHSDTSDNYIVLNINGGIGKNIVATAVVKAIKKQYPEYNIIVVTAWAEVWMNNPYIYRFYKHGITPYFYDNYIKNKNARVMLTEPYLTQEYVINKRYSLAKIWCESLGIKYNNEMPEIFFNNREIEFAENHFVKNRNIMVVQTNGGAANDVQKVSWMRDMPIDVAQYVVNRLSGDAYIYHIRRDDQPALQNTDTLNTHLRFIFYVIKKSKLRLLMDSFAQHAAAAFDLKSTVLWVKNSHVIHGYEKNDNILAKESIEIPTTNNSFLEPYDIQGLIDQCPYPQDTVLFDKNEVLKSVVEQIKK